MATKGNWSKFYGGDITNEDLVVEPNKKVILPTIDAHLNNLWCSEWSGLKGHRQTKYWFTKPDPFLATKLMNMSRENLGKSIQFFFFSHGWWKKTLIQLTSVATMSADCVAKRVQLNHQYTFFQNVLHSLIPEWGCLTTPIPTQQVRRESLCQVAKLIFIDTVRDLIDSDQNSNISSTE